MRFLQPREVVPSLQSVNLPSLWALGKRGIIIDLDNTISPWRSDVLTAEAVRLFQQAHELGYKICLVTNAPVQRTEKIAAAYNLSFVASAMKPRKKPFQKALKKMGLKGDQVVVIGDQLFTDILGGNRAGCYTVLVDPVSRREFIGTKIFRFFEFLVGRPKGKLE